MKWNKFDKFNKDTWPRIDQTVLALNRYGVIHPVRRVERQISNYALGRATVDINLWQDVILSYPNSCLDTFDIQTITHLCEIELPF